MEVLILTIHDGQADERDRAVEELPLGQVMLLENIVHFGQVVVPYRQIQLHFVLRHFQNSTFGIAKNQKLKWTLSEEDRILSKRRREKQERERGRN